MIGERCEAPHFEYQFEDKIAHFVPPFLKPTVYVTVTLDLVVFPMELGFDLRNGIVWIPLNRDLPGPQRWWILAHATGSGVLCGSILDIYGWEVQVSPFSLEYIQLERGAHWSRHTVVPGAYRWGVGAADGIAVGQIERVVTSCDSDLA